MEVKRFDEWNRGCVPFLDKLWKKIDSGLIDGAYVSDNKILINHIIFESLPLFLKQWYFLLI